MSHRLGTPKGFKGLVECPLSCVLDGLVKEEGQEWHGGEPELCNMAHVSSSRQEQRKTLGRPTPIGPYVLILTFFASFNALPEYLTMLCIVNAGKPIEATP